MRLLPSIQGLSAARFAEVTAALEALGQELDGLLEEARASDEVRHAS